MKKIIPLFLLLALPVTARLGENDHELRARYERTTNEKMPFTEFFNDGFRIQAFSLGGLGADVITYQKTEKDKNGKPDRSGKPVPHTLEEVNRHLNVNMEAGAWDKISATEWTHWKEKKSAVYIRDECRLYVFRNDARNDYSWENKKRTISETMGIKDEHCEWPTFHHAQEIITKSRDHKKP
jgi:hypothetical protein